MCYPRGADGHLTRSLQHGWLPQPRRPSAFAFLTFISSERRRTGGAFPFRLSTVLLPHQVGRLRPSSGEPPHVFYSGFLGSGLGEACVRGVYASLLARPFSQPAREDVRGGTRRTPNPQLFNLHQLSFLIRNSFKNKSRDIRLRYPRAPRPQSHTLSFSFTQERETRYNASRCRLHEDNGTCYYTYTAPFTYADYVCQYAYVPVYQR